MYQKNAGTGTQWSQNYEAAADDSGSMRSGLVILQCSCSFPFSVQRLRLGPPLRSDPDSSYVVFDITPPCI